VIAVHVYTNRIL